MSVGKVCIREVVFANPDETAQDAAERMRTERVGTLVVIDGEQHPVGMLTDRDLATRVVAAGRAPERTFVDEIMTSNPETVREATPIERALDHMKSRRVRRVIVVDDQDKLVGLLALDDVLDLLAEEFSTIGELLSRQEPRTHRPRP
ncbi:CBS domain-containing protein [Persicimonas caeni]|nr:CBS domain-containing protein [Persicimonas caeni]